MKKAILIIPVLILVGSIIWFLFPKQAKTPESQFQSYCGNCHLAPNPAHLPRSYWKDPVLPEMAARLGYQYSDYRPTAKNSMQENLYIKRTKTYPQEALIDSLTWKQIYDYILTKAPDEIPVDASRKKRNSALTQFYPVPIALHQNVTALTTSVQFNPTDRQFVIGDALGKFYKYPFNTSLDLKFGSAVVSYEERESGLYIVESGSLDPSEIPLGRMYRLTKDLIDTLAENLHRPVFAQTTDLDDDGVEEVLICEFGNLTGQLSMLVKMGKEWEKKTLLPVPGTIKVKVRDVDGDGRKDLVVLAAQGNEGVFILYQKANLKFEPDQAVKLPPEYGSSWFELVDFDKDGHLDIILANGDNADYTQFLKPYHGIRIFINNGHNSFTEQWFYPIYGATRVLAEDFDQDGDLDLAVLAFFPDFGHNQEESFVYLENEDPVHYRFTAYTTRHSTLGRWLVMDKGDVDQDGDVDILLGSFTRRRPGREYQRVLDRWRNEKVDLLFMENKLR